MTMVHSYGSLNRKRRKEEKEREGRCEGGGRECCEIRRRRRRSGGGGGCSGLGKLKERESQVAIRTVDIDRAAKERSKGRINFHT